MDAAAWRIAGGGLIALDAPRIMAIINVTPDSFSDGGVNLDPAMAAASAARAVADGASILDIGGESTRPGATRVDADEQIRRVVPAIRAIRSAGVTAAISVDTTIARVAQEALDAGASIVNDVSAGDEDPEMLTVCAQRGAGVVLMHRIAPPVGEEYSHRQKGEPDYSAEGGVVRAVCAFLGRRARVAMDAGVDAACIALDPGVGFGKSVAQNYEVIGRIDAVMSLGFPVVSAASRKSFLGAATGQESPADRVEASVAVSVAQFMAGVRIFRVHDVAAHARALAVATRIAHGALESAGE